MLSTAEGLPIISVLRRGANEIIISATVAPMVSIAERSCTEMELSDMRFIMIKGSEGTIIAMGCEYLDADCILAVSVNPNTQIGMVLFEMERFINNLRSGKGMGDDSSQC